MFHIHVKRLINRDIETVFKFLADHENYKQFPGVTDSILTHEGDSERNGTGAQRLIVSGKIKLTERIIKYEPPYTLAYDIEHASPFPLALQHGEIQLVQQGEQTLAEWTSIGKITLPLVGPLFDKLFEKKGAKGFGAIFKYIGQQNR